jgi:two-component system, OmpR family, catabolic regulation response regulator CreB
MRPTVLLLEDDPAIAGTASFALEREGLTVTHLLLARDADALVQRQCPDAAVLDIGLPDGNGLDLCRRWRAAAGTPRATLPILMLTAHGEEIDRVLGLEAGADDYLGKPVLCRGRPLPLTRLEYGLLRELMCARGRILTREVLFDRVWGSGSDAADRTVDTHIKTLRAKLRDALPGAETISTHRGQGYAWVALRD